MCPSRSYPEYIVANINTFRQLLNATMQATAAGYDMGVVNLGICLLLPEGYTLAAFDGQLHICNLADPMLTVYQDDVDREIQEALGRYD